MQEKAVSLQKSRGAISSVRRVWLSRYIYKYAAENDVVGILKCLRSGVDPDKPRENHEFSPLFVALQCGAYDAMKALLRNGADVDQRVPESGETLLAYAMNSQMTEAAIVLLEAGADPNKAQLDDLHHAVALFRLAREHSRYEVEQSFASDPVSVQVLFGQVRSLPRKRNFNGTEWGVAKAA